MTRTRKQNLPALHKSNKLQNPDLPDVENKNYTSTVLKYANLALPFPQLDTNAKRVVPAINELWNNRVVANPPIPGGGTYEIVSDDGYILVSEDDYIITSDGNSDAEALTSIKIDGVIYKIIGESGASSLEELTDVEVENPTDGQILRYDSSEERWVNVDGGGDYSAGRGIFLTGANNSVINAEAGMISPLYKTVTFSREWGQSGEYNQPCWEDSGETHWGDKVYWSFGGTYNMPYGDSLCTFKVEGYDSVSFFIKQNAPDTTTAYVVLGNGYAPIDLDNHTYAISYKGVTLDDYVEYEFTNLYGQPREFEVLYHTDPIPGDDSSGDVSIDLNNGQWADSGQTVGANTVYMSDVGSWHINGGKSTCTIHFSGVDTFTIYVRASSESGYDWVYAGNLDEDVSSSNYNRRYSGETDYTAITYSCSTGEHYIQLLYQKDSSVNSGDDRGYFYCTTGGGGGIHTSRGFVQLIPGAVHNTDRGEIFNNYESNFATGQHSHAEGSGTRAVGYGSHSEGGGTISRGSYAHAEGDNTQAIGSCTHTEGFNTKATAEDSHAEGLGSEAHGAFGHAEGYETKALGDASHAQNRSTIASGENSHAEGRETQATAQRAHAEGGFTLASASAAHAEGYRSTASGENGHAEGYYSEASGFNSHAEGYYAVANYTEAHAEGGNTVSSGHASHAEGKYSVASNSGAHAEGYGDSDAHSTASGQGSHAEGRSTASGAYAHSEGYLNTASGMGSHAEGYGSYTGFNNVSGISGHVEGGGNTVSGNCGHAEGTRNTVYNESGHAEGSGNRIYGRESHIEGSGNTSTEQSSHTEGAGNSNIAHNSHVEGAGNRNTYKATHSHTEGAGNVNYGHQSHIEGAGNSVSGEEAHMEGAGNMSHGAKTHMEGGGNIAYSIGGHVEGKHNFSAGYAHHAEGIDNCIGYSGIPNYFAYGTTYAVGDIVGINDVYGAYVWPETSNTYLYRCITAPGQIQASANVNIVTAVSWDSSTTYASGAVVEVYGIGFYYNSSSDSSTNQNPVLGWPWNRITNILSPFKSSGSGYYMLDCNEASGSSQIAVVYSGTVEPMWEAVAVSSGGHVEGIGNISLGDYQHVQGKYNVSDATKSFIIGNGTSANARSNALTVDWSGNTAIAGDLTVGVALSTTAQTVAGAINEIVAGGASVDYIPNSFIDSLFE